MKSKLLTETIANSLSPLEASIFETLLKHDKPLSTQGIYKLVKRYKKTAKTSVIVALDRLYKNKIVARKPETGLGGIRYIYSLATSKAEYERMIIDKTVNTLLDNFGGTARAYFKEKFKKEE